MEVDKKSHASILNSFCPYLFTYLPSNSKSRSQFYYFTLLFYSKTIQAVTVFLSLKHKTWAYKFNQIVNLLNKGIFQC